MISRLRRKVSEYRYFNAGIHVLYFHAQYYAITVPVFGRKCLVGLVDKAAESLRRYERFFGWDTKIPNSAAKDKCVRQYLEVGDKRKEHPNYVGTAAWETLRKKNEHDEILYEYAKNFYDQQSTIYERSPNDVYRV